jgi:endonuclease/exonuclease/phosphatase family metal-dependent hydrolase
MKYVLYFIILTISILSVDGSAQIKNKQEKSQFRIMFYNLENLFDTYNDPMSNDDEFTPDGDKNWNQYRYQKKLNNLAKVIIALGEWTPPTMIGLCEVENFQVLLDLTTKTPLASLGYQIIHENSNDERGIDVAILFRPVAVQRLSHTSLVVKNDNTWQTRDILLAKMVLAQGDTLNVFVNHWPSRFGGRDNSEFKRIATAETLRYHVDSLQRTNKNSKILIMGDFNDEPNDESINKVLAAKKIKRDIEPKSIYNLSYLDFQEGKGTIVYKEINSTWFMFDQILVTGSLLKGNGIHIEDPKSQIFNPSWLLKDDKPFRTFQGPIYLGGYSDHLPIFIDLYINH